MEFFIGAGAAGEYGGLLERFYEMGFRGCRFDVINDEHFIANINELAYWVQHTPKTKHIYIVNGDSEEEVLQRADLVIANVKGLNLQEHVIIEVLNEPTLNDNWKNRPQAVGKLAKQIWNKTKSDGTLVLAGCVHNLTPDLMDYSEKVLAECPLDIGFSYHRYSTPDLANPVDKNVSRAEEVERLSEVAEDRVIYCTETGQSETQGRRKEFPCCFFGKETYWLSEDEVARQISWETYYWAGTELLSGYGFYNLNDGPDMYNREDRFGWRHFEEAWDGPWKVVAEVMPKILQELDPEYY